VRLTGYRLLLAAGALIAAVLALFLLTRGDNSLRLDAQLTGTVAASQSGASGQYGGSGTGQANSPFGNVSLSAGGGAVPGDTPANCAVFDGTGVLTTAAGTLELRLPKPARACFTAAGLDEATGSGELHVSAKVDATGTSGSLLGRHGSLKAQGSYNLDSGSFTVRVTGRLRR
jgi:hypothetical protein